MPDVFLPCGNGTLSVSDIFLNPSLPARRASVAAATVFFEPGDAATSVYFIHRGQVRLYQVGPNGESRLIDILGPNEWFGSSALSVNTTYSVRAIALTQSVVSQIPAERLLSLLSQQPRAAIELIRHLAGKLKIAREDAARLVFDDCNQRLIKTLVRFSRSAAASPQPGGVVLHITHHQLAQAVGVARETVSLALTQLRHQNLLRTGRNRLTFDPEALRSFLQQHRESPPPATPTPVPAPSAAPEEVAQAG